MADYIPHSEAALLNWATGFSSGIAAMPEAYGLSAADAQCISQVVGAFAEAYRIAGAPLTRTKTNVVIKNAACRAMLPVLRRYAQRIKANPDVSAGLKADIHLRGKPDARATVPAPDTRPSLYVLSNEANCHVLHYSDPTTPDSTRRPADAIGLQVFCHVGSEAPADPLDARFLDFVSRQPYVVRSFKTEQVGKKAFYFARWQNATGATGPWSAVANRMIAG